MSPHIEGFFVSHVFPWPPRAPLRPPRPQKRTRRNRGVGAAEAAGGDWVLLLVFALPLLWLPLSLLLFLPQERSGSARLPGACSSAAAASAAQTPRFRTA